MNGAALRCLEPEPSEVLRQLQRIDEFFCDSPQLRALFRYLVSVCWGGRQLTGKDIAVEFFEEDILEFDAKKNRKVSVSIGRIRKGLAEYYASTGAADPVEITIPKGSFRVGYKLKSGCATEPRADESSQTASDSETPPSADSAQAPFGKWHRSIRRALAVAVPVTMVAVPAGLGIPLGMLLFAMGGPGIYGEEVSEIIEKWKQGRNKQQTSEQPA